MRTNIFRENQVQIRRVPVSLVCVLDHLQGARWDLHPHSEVARGEEKCQALSKRCLKTCFSSAPQSEVRSTGHQEGQHESWPRLLRYSRTVLGGVADTRWQTRRVGLWEARQEEQRTRPKLQRTRGPRTRHQKALWKQLLTTLAIISRVCSNITFVAVQFSGFYHACRLRV